MREKIASSAARHGLAVIILLFGLAYAALTAPFGVPDEFAHFWRACHVSEGHILAQVRPAGERGDMLPRSVDEIVETLAHYRSVPLPATHIDWEGWKRAWKMGFHSKDRQFRSFSATASYSPFPYLPSAIAITLSRKCHLSILAAFYLARFANVIAAAALLGLAWRRLPLARESFALTVMLPMTLSQIGSLSADAVSFGFAFLWIALVLNFTCAEESPPTTWRRERVEVFAVAALLGQTKFFFPLLLLALLCFLRPEKSARRTTPVCLGALGIGLVSATVWAVASDSLIYATRLDAAANPVRQIAFLCEHPAQFLEICAHTFQGSVIQYARQIIGVLGWLQTQLPNWLYLGMWMALIVSTGFQEPHDRDKINSAGRIFCALLAITMLLCVFAAVYVMWNVAGATSIEGIQGRYLILMLPLLGIASMSPLWPRLHAAVAIRISMYAFVLIANACALFIQFGRAFE